MLDDSVHLVGRDSGIPDATTLRKHDLTKASAFDNQKSCSAHLHVASVSVAANVRGLDDERRKT